LLEATGAVLEMDLSPFSVVKYSKDHVVDFIRYMTGWNSRAEVASKSQLQYLFAYLEKDHIDVKTIVTESEYVEKHYLEDYSEYYVRCFNQHPRLCSRIHFFSNKFTEAEFQTALQSNNKNVLSNQNYIGYIVIRPIPDTFLAKICIRPYKALVKSKDHKLIKKINCVSLFGVPLTVDTLALQEQDKVVAACATSALWSLLSGYPDFCSNQIPSLSAITKTAVASDIDGSRTFPNKGLRPAQVAHSLKKYGLEPSIYKYREEGMSCLDEVKANIYAYLSNDIPVLLGGKVYSKENGSIIELGEHFVCVLGYEIKDDKIPYKNGVLTLKSKGITKLYAHDDRYGPYAKLELDVVEWVDNQDEKTKLPNNEKKRNKKGLLLSHEFEEDDLFIPDILIFGHYHKIRITYLEIEEICFILHQIISMYLAEELFDKATEKVKNPLQKAYSEMSNGVWDISLITVNNLKEEIIGSNDWKSSNGGDRKSDFLAKLHPKYIWRCRVINSGNKITDILFDATEVPQGKIILGYISYSPEAELFWQHVDSEIKRRGWDGFYKVLNESDRSTLNSIVRFFIADSGAIGLNLLYGPSSLPRRSLKPGESDGLGNVTQRQDLVYIRGDTHANLSSLNLNKENKYIWVINKEGDFVLGEDVDGDSQKEGHPTLVDGAPARLGGELFYSVNGNVWYINTKSGTYSTHLAEDPRLAEKYLETVVRNKLPEQNIEIQPQPW